MFTKSFIKTAVSKDWVKKHVLSGLNKRFSKYRGLNNPKLMAHAHADEVSKAVVSGGAKDKVSRLTHLYPKRKLAKDVY